MDEIENSDGQPAKRVRTPGVRYPGASLARVFQALGVIHAAGGTATIGTLATRIRMSETNADFVRLVASSRSYGMADWANANRSALSLTPEGETALGPDQEAARTARQRAALRPDVFQRVARRFEGRALPAPDDLNEAFIVNRVAPSGAPLAARNFVESLTFAELVEEDSGRQLVRGDLPYPEPEGGPDGVERSAVATPARATAPAAARTQAAPVRQASAKTPPAAPPRDAAAGRSGPQIEVKLDVSGWTVDQVIELVNKLEARGRRS